MRHSSRLASLCVIGLLHSLARSLNRASADDVLRLDLLKTLPLFSH